MAYIFPSTYPSISFVYEEFAKIEVHKFLVMIYKLILSFILLSIVVYLTNRFHPYTLHEHNRNIELISPGIEFSESHSVVIYALVTGTCSSNAHNIHKWQVFVNNLTREDVKLVFVLQGELDYYFNQLYKDETMRQFPAIHDPTFNFLNANNLIATSEDRVLIVNHNKKVLFLGDPMRLKPHYDSMLKLLSNTIYV